jgi:SET domain-containing protein
VVLNQSEVLEVRQSPGKGRGVFAKVDIPKGAVFERVPLLVVETDELEGSELMDYVFVWSKKTVAIALGYGSLYNHSYKPNARYYDGPGRTKVFMAVRTIRAGEEILVNYNGDPKGREKVEFDVIENGNGHVEGVNSPVSPSTNGDSPRRTSKSRESTGRKRQSASR